MSRWTHVVAAFRCDWIGGEAAPDEVGMMLYDGQVMSPYGVAEQVIGRELTFPEANGLGIDYSPEEFEDACQVYDSLWEEKEKHPERFLPCGSEGSCHMFVNDEGYGRKVVTVVGDLRDFGGPDDVQSVCDWFDRACSRVAALRQATCSILDEWSDEPPVMLESGARSVWMDTEDGGAVAG